MISTIREGRWDGRMMPVRHTRNLHICISLSRVGPQTQTGRVLQRRWHYAQIIRRIKRVREPESRNKHWSSQKKGYAIRAIMHEVSSHCGDEPQRSDKVKRPEECHISTASWTWHRSIDWFWTSKQPHTMLEESVVHITPVSLVGCGSNSALPLEKTEFR